MGKTRLALEAGRRVAPRFTDGVGFVPLAPSPDGLVATIAAALRLPRVSTEPPDASVTAELLDRAALLILDNFESVIEFATQIGDLVAAAPRLRLLVTSRVALRLTGEQAVAVAPLTVPDPDARLSAVLQSDALTGLCFLTLALARFDGREDEFEAMVDAARACEDPVCLAIALGNCGELRLAGGDVAPAVELISQSLRMCGQLAMAYVGAFSLDSAATLLASVGEPAAAVRVEAAAEVAMQRIQASWWQPRVARRNRLLADAGTRLGEAGYTDAWDSGADLTFHAAVDVARAALQTVAPTARTGRP